MTTANQTTQTLPRERKPQAVKGFLFEMIKVGNQRLRVGIRHSRKGGIPLLLFNGIGGNAELLQPFVDALPDRTVITFDIPGVGHSPMPARPYRMSGIARLAHQLLLQLGHLQVDVLGISWGGTVAQQFARNYPRQCRKLVLAATTPGAIMFPGKLGIILKMASPRRYIDADYARRIVGDIYGGAFRLNPDLGREHFQHVRWQSRLGYYLQLFAISGWSSLPWLHRLQQPTLIMIGLDDPITPPANGRLMHVLMPNAELWHSHCGHLFLVTQAKDSAVAVHRFLQQP